MVKLVDGKSLFNAFRAEIAKADSVKLAIAFWGKGAVEALGLRADQRIDVICNLDMGGTNPSEIEELLKIGATVRPLNTLHAKMGIVGNMGFVGSSNASTNGMGLQGIETSGWQELNTIFSGTDAVSALTKKFAYFERLSSEPLVENSSKLVEAKKRWDLRRSDLGDYIAKSAKSNNLWDELCNNPDFFDGQNAYVVMSQPLTGEEGAKFQKATEEVKLEFGLDYSIYFYWPNLPENAPLLDFSIEDGKVNYDGVFVRDSRLPKQDGEQQQLCIKRPDFLGMNPLPKAEQAPHFKAAIKSFYHEQRRMSEETWTFRAIEEFARFLKTNRGKFGGT